MFIFESKTSAENQIIVQKKQGFLPGLSLRDGQDAQNFRALLLRASRKRQFTALQQ